MTKLHLSSAERAFFSRVTRAVFANPFSDDRVSADLEIADVPPSLPYEERQQRVIEAVTGMIKKLDDADKGDIRKFSGKDRILIENGFLFHMFHQFHKSFDRLIQDQIHAGDTPCIVPFAQDALSMMVRHGFTNEDALRYFALAFQTRRAYHFINRSIIGSSSCMKELRLNLWNNVFTHDIGQYARYLWNRMEDYSTLLLGETGTGKGISAASIGRSGFIPFDEKKGTFSESFTRAFVPLNLSQYPEQLIESELFGHTKGAFTGAIADHEGIFSRCSPHGAIFLDEIGEISIPIQIKLLQILQERVFSPVGSHKKQRFYGRIIAATNRPPHELRSEKCFRDDFFYRLCSDIIIVPPLRLRIQQDRQELDDLLRHTLTRILGEPAPEIFEKVRGITEKQLPLEYPWPGNVRELEQCVRRILLKNNYSIDTEAIPAHTNVQQFFNSINEGTINAQELLSGYCKLLYEQFGTYEAVSRRTALDRRTVKKYIEKAENDG